MDREFENDGEQLFGDDDVRLGNSDGHAGTEDAAAEELHRAWPDDEPDEPDNADAEKQFYFLWVRASLVRFDSRPTPRTPHPRNETHTTRRTGRINPGALFV